MLQFIFKFRHARKEERNVHNHRRFHGGGGRGNLRHRQDSHPQQRGLAFDRQPERDGGGLAVPAGCRHWHVVARRGVRGVRHLDDDDPVVVLLSLARRGQSARVVGDRPLAPTDHNPRPPYSQ